MTPPLSFYFFYPRLQMMIARGESVAFVVLEQKDLAQGLTIKMHATVSDV